MMRGKERGLAWPVGAVVACAALLHVVRCSGEAPAGGSTPDGWPRPTAHACPGVTPRPEKPVFLSAGQQADGCGVTERSVAEWREFAAGSGLSIYQRMKGFHS